MKILGLTWNNVLIVSLLYNFGFVYKITNLLNGRSYIGRKYFWSFRNPTRKERKAKQESIEKILWFLS